MWTLPFRGTEPLMFGRAGRVRFERAHAARLPIGQDGVVIGAETIELSGATRRAALLLHGFNDTPQSMSYLADRVHAAGWNVLVPRLPGHGVALEIMAAESRADAWRACTESCYASLRAKNDTVVVCGQSMGGALAVLLGAVHPELPALVLLAPYLGMPARLQLQVIGAWLSRPVSLYHTGTGGERSIHDPVAKAAALGPGIITARMMTELCRTAHAAASRMPQLTTPTLYMQSRSDNRIAVAGAERHFAAIGSREKSQQWLTGCGHIISADYCRDEVATRVIDWFNRHDAVRDVMPDSR